MTVQWLANVPRQYEPVGSPGIRLIGLHLEHLIQHFIAPRRTVRGRDACSVLCAHLVSLNPPFFALHNGDRIAIVMTTSSGDLRSSASRPFTAPGVR